MSDIFPPWEAAALFFEQVRDLDLSAEARSEFLKDALHHLQDGDTALNVTLMATALIRERNDWQSKANAQRDEAMAQRARADEAEARAAAATMAAPTPPAGFMVVAALLCIGWPHAAALSWRVGDLSSFMVTGLFGFASIALFGVVSIVWYRERIEKREAQESQARRRKLWRRDP